MLMSAADYRESLRRYSPRVFVNGRAVESVADDPALTPGIAAVGITYDFALRPEYRALMTARQDTSGRLVNRMVHINETTGDLLSKLEAVRLVCKESGCAQRYLTHDALNSIFEATYRMDAAHGTGYHRHFVAYLHRIQDEDLTLGVTMTDAKGDRSRCPGEQANPDVYVHIAERRPDGIVIRGAKAIVTGAPLRARVPRHALPDDEGGGRGLRRVLRRAGRRAGRHDRRPPRRPPGRGGRQVLGLVRAIHRRRDLRRLRALGSGLSRRRA